MEIPLKTTNIWETSEAFDMRSFFNAFGSILCEHDRLVLGSYQVADEIREWLLAHESPLAAEGRPFRDSFQYNLSEYPDGRCYAFFATAPVLKALGDFCLIPNGGVERDLYFDHLVAYRPGRPIVPLINFHDAPFGALTLSGLFSEAEISAFTALFGATAKCVPFNAWGE